MYSSHKGLAQPLRTDFLSHQEACHLHLQIFWCWCTRPSTAWNLPTLNASVYCAVYLPNVWRLPRPIRIRTTFSVLQPMRKCCRRRIHVLKSPSSWSWCSRSNLCPYDGRECCCHGQIVRSGIFFLRHQITGLNSPSRFRFRIVVIFPPHLEHRGTSSSSASSKS